MREALHVDRFSSLTAYMAKTLTNIFAIIFILLGLLGFVSNPLIGINALFATDAMHNVLHLVLGVVLLLVAFWANKNLLLWLKIIGALVFLLGVFGIFTVPSTGGTLLGFAFTNGASNWFHLIIGVAIFASGIYGKNDTIMPPVSSVQPPNSRRFM